jgi:hypothetical protein
MLRLQKHRKGTGSVPFLVAANGLAGRDGNWLAREDCLPTVTGSDRHGSKVAVTLLALATTVIAATTPISIATTRWCFRIFDPQRLSRDQTRRTRAKCVLRTSLRRHVGSTAGSTGFFGSHIKRKRERRTVPPLAR